MSLIQFLINSKSGHREQNARNAVTGASGASPGWYGVTSAQRDLAGLEGHNGRGQCGDVMTMGIRWEMQPSSAAVMQAEIGEMGAVHESSPAPAQAHSTGTLLTTVHTNKSTINILCMPTLHSHALDLQSIDAVKDQGVIVPTEINRMLHCCTLPVSQKMQLS